MSPSVRSNGSPPKIKVNLKSRPLWKKRDMSEKIWANFDTQQHKGGTIQSPVILIQSHFDASDFDTSLFTVEL